MKKNLIKVLFSTMVLTAATFIIVPTTAEAKVRLQISDTEITSMEDLDNLEISVKNLKKGYTFKTVSEITKNGKTVVKVFIYKDGKKVKSLKQTININIPEWTNKKSSEEKPVNEADSIEEKPVEEETLAKEKAVSEASPAEKKDTQKITSNNESIFDENGHQRLNVIVTDKVAANDNKGSFFAEGTHAIETSSGNNYVVTIEDGITYVLESTNNSQAQDEVGGESTCEVNGEGYYSTYENAVHDTDSVFITDNGSLAIGDPYTWAIVLD